MAVIPPAECLDRQELTSEMFRPALRGALFRRESNVRHSQAAFAASERQAREAAT